EIYLRQRAFGSSLGLRAGFHLHGDRNDQASAPGPKRISIICLHISSCSSLCREARQRCGCKCENSACYQKFTAVDHDTSAKPAMLNSRWRELLRTRACNAEVVSHLARALGPTLLTISLVFLTDSGTNSACGHP